MTGQSPELTVVIPTLGLRLDWLQLTLESIRRQDVPMLILAVAPAEAHHRIAGLVEEAGGTLIAQESTGLAAAINEGFRASSTPFVSWLGDDDVLVPGSAGSLLALMRSHDEAPFAYGRMLLFDEHGRYLWTIRPTRFAPNAARFLRNFVPQQGTIFRASALKSVGYADESLRFAMDLDLWLRLSRVGHPVYLPRPVGGFRWHAGGLTMGNYASIEEAQQVRIRNAPPWQRPWLRLLRKPFHFVYKVVHKLGVLRRDQTAADLERMVGITAPEGP